MKIIKKIFWIGLTISLLLVGCGTDVDSPTENVIEPTEVLLTPTSIPPTLSPAPTAAPTARLLVEPVEGEAGRYTNDLLGVSFSYPSDWTLFESNQDGPILLIVDHPFLGYRTFLFTIDLEEDQTMEEYHLNFVKEISTGIEMTEMEPVEYSYDEVLGNGLSAERITQKGNLEGDFVIDIVSTENGGRVYSVIVLSPASDYEAVEEDLLDIQGSLAFYVASPYGVSRDNAMFFSSGEPQTLDPALMQGSAGSIIGDIFSGLVRLDTNLRPIPDLAESWEVSEDGLVYTFYLRRYIQFHSGRAFTAEDVIYSWERATDPDLESPTAPTYMIDIKGVQEKLDGGADQISGLRMIDEYTLEVTLDAPKAYFLSKLSYPTSWIVDSETVDEVEDNPIGTGPFKLIKHVEDEIIILGRNEYYYGNFVQLEYIVYLLYQGVSTRMYEGGQIDMISVSEDMLDRVEDANDPLHGTVQSASSLCTFYVLFDNATPPFDDPKVREAFALAVDKGRLNEILTEGRGVIANGLLPPGMPGYTPDIFPVEYNEELALQALADSTYGSADALPEITFTARGFGSGVGAGVGYFIQAWQDLFGITINVDQIQTTDYWDEIQAGNHGNVFNLGWCADYPDPENFLDLLFYSGADLNVANFNNAEYDVLIEAARVETDIETRLALYQQAEQILVDAVGGIFYGHSRAGYLVTKPYIKGFVNTPIGVAQMMNVYIELDE